MRRIIVRFLVLLVALAGLSLSANGHAAEAFLGHELSPPAAAPTLDPAASPEGHADVGTPPHGCHALAHCVGILPAALAVGGEGGRGHAACRTAFSRASGRKPPTQPPKA